MARPKSSTTIYRSDYHPSPYLVDEISLLVQLFDHETLVTATSQIHKNPEVGAGEAHPLTLNGRELELLRIIVNNRILTPDEYQVDANGLVISSVPDTCTVSITTRIHPENNTSLEGLYCSSGNYCTQCEAQGFRRITYYLDRPDVLARYTTRIEAEREHYPVLLANGNLTEQGELARGRHYAVWTDPFPKPCYLFAMVAGQLVALRDEFVTRSGRTIALAIYVEEKNRNRCDHAMVSLKKSMAWDEEVFGLEYDLDQYMIVAVDDFNMGAMENKGLNIFNSKYVLASPETATDQDYLGIEGVIAHEYFHNWTGNRVTCRDWFQLSLKEGLTVFRDQEFSSDMNSRAVKRIEEVRVLKTFQFREDSGPMAHPVRPDSYEEINNFYTVTVYNKGAEVVRMIHTLLGTEGFRKGMDLYFHRHDGQAVTCDDFVAAMSDATGFDLSIFTLWYSQAGTPILTVSEDWQEKDGRYSLTISQSCPATPGQESKEPFHIPISFGLLDQNGEEVPLPSNLLELRQQEETFVFDGLSGRPVPSLLRSFSAPVKMQIKRSRAEHAFLMAHDTDLFNRWDSAMMLFEDIILQLASSTNPGQKESLDPILMDTVRSLLNDQENDPALQALALTLPPETYLAQQMEIVDPDRLHQARQLVRNELGEQLAEDWRRVYNANNEPGVYSLDPGAIGLRSLKNCALSALLAVTSPKADDISLVHRQFVKANNMTDCLAALAILSNCNCSEREQALASFHKRWQHEPLVIDKWLTIQATSCLESTLDTVKNLMIHPAFSIRNPNRVRSLIGAFGTNHVRFHARNGSGYRFLADQILTLDPINPQTAARLVTPFTTWKRFDHNRQQLIQIELERILAQHGLSADVSEIVSKSLAH
ncbi:MAG: aminopeptidase N [Desulfobulbaceae bacterium]|uniref:Aminopeptidase N n=1 Tax=Candidatus Desulfatifera sulfidica TaxID=2841691 RepID=A0A8J6N7T4_9BACT|nr:aminopeptidase N [Candidatus Desulfatifera sulfidica]